MGIRDIFEAVEDPVAVLLGLLALIFPLAASRQLRRALTIRYRDSSVDSNIPGTTSIKAAPRANVASIRCRKAFEGPESKGPKNPWPQEGGPARHRDGGCGLGDSDRRLGFQKIPTAFIAQSGWATVKLGIDLGEVFSKAPELANYFCKGRGPGQKIPTASREGQPDDKFPELAGCRSGMSNGYTGYI